MPAVPSISATIPALSEQEQQLIYNVEVLGLSVRRAGDLVGMPDPYSVLGRREVAEARERLREEVRKRAEITKEDVVHGIKDAIDQAKTLADPTAQIMGWREIAKMLGYDAPREIKITVSSETRVLRKQIAQLDDDALVELLGAEDVIDADFYEVRDNGRA